MIKVTVTYLEKSSHVISLEMKGHANSAPHGEDLVCAAASAIVIGGINAIEDDNNFHYEVKEGYVLIEALNESSKDDDIRLKTIIAQLKSLEHDYAKFIKIEERKK